MKLSTTLVTLATIAIATTEAAQGAAFVTPKISLTQDFDPSRMSQGQILKFFEMVGKTYWKATIRGWYSSSDRTL